MVGYEFYVGEPSSIMKNFSDFWFVSENVIENILDRVIQPDEKVKGIIIGKIENPAPWGLWVEIDKTRHSQIGEGRDGALICTDKRLIFYMPKLLGRWEVESAPLEQISSVQYSKGLFSSRIHLTVFNDEKVIKWVNNEDAKVIIDIIEEELHRTKKQNIVAVNPLSELKLRLVRGEVSKEEYLELKRILDQ